MRVWEGQSRGQLKRTITGNGSFRSLGWSRDGRTIIGVEGKATEPANPGAVRLWEEANGTLIQTMEGSAQVACLSPDANEVVGIEGNDTIVFWDARTGKVKRRLKASAMNEVVFSPDGSILVGVSNDGSTKLWRLR